MIPRTPTGDLIAAFVLAAAFGALVYVSARSGRLGAIDRAARPGLFWAVLGTACGVGFAVAGLVAWEALGG